MLTDPFFTYKNSLRFLLVHKLGFISNVHELPRFKQVCIFFYLKKLEDMDEVQIYNYFYLLKFFFSKVAFFGKMKKFFLLGKWYNNFQVQLFLEKPSEAYVFIFQFFNNILPLADKALWMFRWNPRYSNIFYLLFRDLNVFNERKTNLGLFYLKKPLSLNLIFGGTLKISNQMHLNALKFF